VSLESLGWGPDLGHAFSLLLSQSSLPLVPGRVVRQERGLLTVQTSERAWLARPSGRLLHQAPGAEALPTIGDWVALLLPSGDGEALLHALLPRRSVLMRRGAGSEHEGQLLAANLDVVFLVAGLDGNYNPRRIERALTLAWNSGAEPVVVLSKADLHEDVSGRVLEVQSLSPGVPVLALSAQQGTGLEALRERLPAGKTGALLGSSGVGKSTLVNRLLEEARLATQPVRPDDDRGRHTTTHRELFVLPHGGLLIDGPGMRELGVVDDAGIDTAYADVTELAAACRFRDCTHRTEPGCAVAAAIDDGRLDPARYTAWRKLQAEAHRQALRSDARARAAEHARVRALHRSYRAQPHRSR